MDIVRAVAEKVALDDPARTVTLEGTMSKAGLVFVSVARAPPDGAALLSVTVQVVFWEDAIEAGLQLKPVNVAAPGAAAVTVTAPPAPEIASAVLSAADPSVFVTPMVADC